MTNNVARLIDACCEIFERSLVGGDLSDANGVTHCNEAVNYVAKAMGYNGFDKLKTLDPTDAILANQMYDAMASNPEWMEVDGTVAQAHANNGALVIAAWKNPTGIHGHVAVVRPGQLTHSMKWANQPPQPARIPKIVNVGKAECRYIARGANWSFGEEPKYFVLKATLK